MRTVRYLLLPVLNICGPVFAAFSLFMLGMGLYSLDQGDGAHWAFFLGFAVTLLVGGTITALTLRARRELVPRDGFLLATIVWVAVPLFASIPLYAGIEGVSFTHAFFESMSGTTTTCASVLTGLDNLPASINAWRCMLSWLGGLGILVLAVAILPLLGVGGAQIFRAEASGPLKGSKLTPRIADTAKGLFWIYFGLSIACCVSYRLAGMTTYDAVVHTFTTVSLGGYSSHDASFGYWNSPAIEWVAITFMLICGGSFSLHFTAIRRRSPLPYLLDPEFRCWIATAIIACAAVTGLLYADGTFSTIPEAARHAIFNTMSVISTTGFSSDDYWLWPAAAPCLMVICACFATCGGSTGGGVKMMRTIILFKQSFAEFTRTLHPRAMLRIAVGENEISEPLVFAVLAYMQLWVGMTVACSLILMATGADPVTAVSAAVACVTNLGPGLGAVGPGGCFDCFNDLQLWLCCFCMLAGRLELMTVLVLFSRNFWKL